MSNGEKSRQYFSEAVKYLPGGVNSPVRSFAAVGGGPLFIERGDGAYIWDVDKNLYIDYVLSWGPLILGHRYPQVIAAVSEALSCGTSFGAPTPGETSLARLINRAVPSMELIRLVNSGTEATMSALRLARAYTGRNKILKFAGCYHGHADSLLIKAGSGSLTLGVPTSPGITGGVAEDTIVSRYNNPEITEEIFRREGEQIAAVIVEPVCGNMGVVLPRDGFLQKLRELTEKYGTVLIFDEVITCCRAGFMGAQQYYGVTPDLTCLGKIIGGGLPIGAYGGKREIMDMIAPSGPVYQAGTLAGNPLAVAAGMATLQALASPDIYSELENNCLKLTRGLEEACAAAGVKVAVNRFGSMFTLFFTGERVIDYESALTANTRLYSAFFHGMLEHGVYFPPSQFEASFLSVLHRDGEVERTLEGARACLERLAEGTGDN